MSAGRYLYLIGNGDQIETPKKKHHCRMSTAPPKNKKHSVQKVPLYGIYEEVLHLKLICTHQVHQNPRKTSLVEVKMRFSRVLVCLVGANQFQM